MTHLAVLELDGTRVDTPRAIIETLTAAFAGMGAPRGTQRPSGGQSSFPSRKPSAISLDVPQVDARRLAGASHVHDWVLPRSVIQRDSIAERPDATPKPAE
jgi:phosphoglycolate phosphatase